MRLRKYMMINSRPQENVRGNEVTYTRLHKHSDMETPQQTEERIWDFIDGRSSAEERAVISRLITEDPYWKRLHLELVQVNIALDQQELETPSLRFTKNVMEQIARHHVAPATKNYINKNIIRGIMAFFLVMIGGILIYFISQFHWSSSSSVNFIPTRYLSADKLDFGKVLNDTSVNLFVLVNVILGFMLLDKYLQRRKKSRSGEGSVYSSGS